MKNNIRFGCSVVTIVLLFPITLSAFVGMMLNAVGFFGFPPCWAFGILAIFFC